MLLPMILRILDQHQIQPKLVDKPKSGFRSSLDAAVEEASRPEKGVEVTDAPESLKSQNTELQSQPKPTVSSNLEELLRIITKFEKSDQSRVVDVFE